uniref:Tetraacyldisaccharide 4'-kinase n=1 Tax=Rheinheimera sp. BAL341 TaxID=1708203 RepID=A0A486XGL5_9GAMM
MWYQQGRIYWLLLPLSALYWLLSALRRALFRYGLKRQIKLPVPVIVVGNISVGGTGKTPFTLLLADLLRQQGWRPGIISRGYGARITQPVLVSKTSDARQVGDEPLLLAQTSDCPVVVCPDRVAAAQHLLANSDCNIIISDDGLQHYRLARDIEIVLLDGHRGLGNGHLLPAGPLREGIWRLGQVDLVVANSAASALADGVMLLQPTAAQSLISKALLSPCAVSLVAGIGNPQRFENTVRTAGFSIQGRHYFTDHHQFIAADFDAIPGPVLMTEKDAVKCRPFAQPDWYSLAVQAKPDTAIMTKLSTILTNLRSSYGA